MSVRTALAAFVFAGATLASAEASVFYSNGFETDIAGWNVFSAGFHPTRVATGTGGIASASGGFHAVSSASGSAGNWGGYTLNPGCIATGCAAGAFPAGGYTTSVDIWLDVNAGLANNTRFDFSSAINVPTGAHRRDFIFNAGFYDDADGSPGSGTNRFVISASTNSQPGSAFAKNPARSPIAISTTGWYTFQHRFYDDGSGVLAVDLGIFDSSMTLVNLWTVSDPSDIIGTTVGGNRYGWFAYNELPTLAFDNAQLSVAMPEPGTLAVFGLGLLGLAALRRRDNPAINAAA